MSHVTAASVTISEEHLDCLIEALKQFKEATWKENQKTHAWFGRWLNDLSSQAAANQRGIDPSQYGKCTHAISFSNSDYEVGVVRRSDGTGLSLVWDAWGTGNNISKTIGSNAEKLMIAYNQAVVLKKASQLGCLTRWETLGDGRRQLVVTKPGGFTKQTVGGAGRWG